MLHLLDYLLEHYQQRYPENLVPASQVVEAFKDLLRANPPLIFRPGEWLDVQLADNTVVAVGFPEGSGQGQENFYLDLGLGVARATTPTWSAQI